MKRYIKSAITDDISNYDLVTCLDIAYDTRNQELLRQLSKHESVYVREAVAMNKRTPIDVLEELSNDPAANIRSWVAMAEISPDTRLRLSCDPDAEVRRAVAWSWHTPVDILRRLLNDEDSNVRDKAIETMERHGYKL